MQDFPHHQQDIHLSRSSVPVHFLSGPHPGLPRGVVAKHRRGNFACARGDGQRRTSAAKECKTWQPDYLAHALRLLLLANSKDMHITQEL